MYAVFDIDETLTIARAEKTELLPSFPLTAPGQMDPWRDECANDIANMAMVDLYKMYQVMGYEMVLLTARGGDARGITEAWMADHGITYDMLIMRTLEQDNTPTVEYKEGAVNTHLNGAWDDIAIMVDDHKGVCAMFNDKGVTTIDPLASAS